MTEERDKHRERPTERMRYSKRGKMDLERGRAGGRDRARDRERARGR